MAAQIPGICAHTCESLQPPRRLLSGAPLAQGLTQAPAGVLARGAATGRLAGGGVCFQAQADGCLQASEGPLPSSFTRLLAGFCSLRAVGPRTSGSCRLSAGDLSAFLRGPLHAGQLGIAACFPRSTQAGEQEKVSSAEASLLVT